MQGRSSSAIWCPRRWLLSAIALRNAIKPIENSGLARAIGRLPSPAPCPRGSVPLRAAAARQAVESPAQPAGDYVCGWMGDGKCLKYFGGPGEIRTHDLFHAMEARSQLRHRPIVREAVFYFTIPRAH